ncbi:MAG: adenylate cyclase [Parasphingorhabdus sp.]|jgi:adenylate cyclase
MTDRTSRRLAVILHADIVSSTSLVQLDETIAHERMRDAFIRFSNLISEHGGTAHEIRGDALVAEFSTTSGAIAAALEFQSANSLFVEQLDDKILPVLRIGIAMGEVIIADNTITGEGVVLAQRLEQLALPGGVCLQGAAQETVPKRLSYNYKDIGEHELKGFAQPVKAYFVTSGEQEAREDQSPAVTTNPVAAPNKKPSIAVLPFINRSQDAEQEFFSDGISEDIITELSRFPMLFVIARHSSFTFKGKDIGITDIGKQLGVSYIVAGSVRRAGNRVRISAELIEQGNGNQIWAQRYDRDLEDIFAVQDEVVRSIVAALPGRVAQDLLNHTAIKPPENLQSYELVLRGKAQYNLINVESLVLAAELFEQAVRADPTYARAHAHLADTYVSDTVLGFANAAEKALVHARKACSLDNNDIYCTTMLGWAYIANCMWSEANAMFEKVAAQLACEVDPIVWTGEAFTLLGRLEEGRKLVQEAMRLDPLHPALYEWVLGENFWYQGNYEDVVKVLSGGALLNSLAYAYLATAHHKLGNSRESQTALNSFVAERRHEIIARQGSIKNNSVSELTLAFRNSFRLEADWLRLTKGLEAAGLPA